MGLFLSSFSIKSPVLQQSQAVVTHHKLLRRLNGICLEDRYVIFRIFRKPYTAHQNLLADIYPTLL